MQKPTRPLRTSRPLPCALWLALCAPACGSTGSPAQDVPAAPDDASDALALATDALVDDASTSADADASPTPCPTGPAPTEPGVVQTQQGLFRGVRRGETYAYLGVPFAAPPVGALRWQKPRAPACHEGVRDANAYGAVCPQFDDARAVVGNEDCLTLNVWAPVAPPPSGTSYPVLVFVHGGGNNQGSASVAVGGTAVYDGQSLAQRGAVVVTIQYRLGALGFLTHEALEAPPSDTTRSGAYGLYDQLAAFAWVRQNAGVFRGDPARVLAFGESAGAQDVTALAASPLSRGLFTRVLSESGGPVAMTRTRALASGVRFADAARCTDPAARAACMRALSTEQVIRAIPAEVNGLVSNEFVPHVDGVLLPVGTQEAFTLGSHTHMPMVLGTNSDEASRMVPGPAMIATEAQYENVARAYLAQYGLTPAAVNRVIAVYPTSAYPSPWHAAVALATDTRWTCPLRVLARAAVASQTEPVRRYFFSHTLDAAGAPVVSRFGAYHAIELAYVFGALELGGYRPTVADRAVSDAVQRYWVQFAATGDPNVSGLSPWPAYEARTDPYLEIRDPLRSATGVRAGLCDALERAIAGG